MILTISPIMFPNLHTAADMTPLDFCPSEYLEPPPMENFAKNRKMSRVLHQVKREKVFFFFFF